MESIQASVPPTQIRSARALMGWSQRELARRAQVGTSTVADFERGARAPTTNNIQSMIKALEEGGVVFTGNSVARRTTARASSPPVAGITPFRWIEVADLDEWANRRGSQELLPELVSRLIRADGGIDVELRLPSADAISMKGWDGRCRVETGSAYVPSGISGWELSVQKEGIKGKADEAYEARIKSPGDLEPSQTTFIFVTARRWESKGEWIKTRKAERHWKDVRVYDSVDLVHWLETFPSVTTWLAEKIGKRPVNLRDLESVWNEWAQATERPIATALVLAGRDEEATRCIKWFQESPSPIALQAESSAEAISFLYAAIAQLPPAERDAFLTRCVVVRDGDQARRLGESLTALYLVIEDADAGLVRKLVGQSHHVCSVFGSEIGIPADVLRLPRLSRPDAEAALRTMGFRDEEARTVARDIAGSLAVYRRLYPSAPERALPDWARPENAGNILPAFLAGSWDEDKPADREVLQRLSGKPYDEFQKTLSPWISLPDSPLRKSGSVWKIASPRDALFRLAPVVSSADLKRFSEVAGEVFRTPDPRFSVAPDERWLAGVRGQMPQHSLFLRDGLGETLLVLALFGGKATVAGSKQTTEEIVRDLLYGADAIRWWSLSGQMRLLSEAAPEQFLSSVGKSLQRNDPPIMELFKEDGGLLGGAHHSDLLWALESLAWDPKYLADVAKLLATMARLDPPGGRYSNRPLNSLRSIFVWWMPQTCADFSDRMAVLDLIRKDEPAITWKLMLALLPGNRDFLDPSAKPRWREIPPELPEQSNTHAMIREAEALGGRLLSDVGSDVDRWVSLIRSFPELPPRDLERACTALSARTDSFDSNGRASVWKALRALLHKHRSLADADWALPEEALAPLDPIYAAFEPGDRIEQIAWLFNTGSVDLPEKLDGGWEAYEGESEIRRRHAVEKLWDDTGREGIERLAQAVEQPWLIGFALADSGLHEHEKDTVLVGGLQSPDAKLESVARGFIGRTLEKERAAGYGEEWAYGLLDRATAEAWSGQALLIIASVMTASRRLWNRVEQFGPGMADDYWKTLSPFRIPPAEEDVATAVDKFMKHQRAGALMSVVSRTPQGVSSAKIVEILREAIPSLESHRNNNDIVMFQHYLEKLLTELDRRADVDETTIAQLEWLYLPLLRHSKRPPRALHKSLSEQPAFFVDVLKTVYRSSLETDATENGTDDKERHKQVVTQAYELLRSWHLIPGMENGVIDGAKLEAWIAETRRLANEAGRIDPCDAYIGRMLAYAPIGDDGVWPAHAVRNVIEISRSEVIERSISGGILDKRGVTFRSPTAGGEEEKALAAQYRVWSEALRFKSPRTSAALEDVAKTFDGFAERHDQDVERSGWL